MCKIILDSIKCCQVFKIFYLFIFRKKGREGEREGKKHQCVVASSTPPAEWGPGPQPRFVPWLGIEPATLWFTCRHSVHWATPARVNQHFQSRLITNISPRLCSKMHKSSKAKFNFKATYNACIEGVFLRDFQVLGEFHNIKLVC